MVQDLAVRSEKNSLGMIDATFQELMAADTPEEQATLLVLVNELFADSSCRCEEMEAAYGKASEEALACNRSVSKSQDEMRKLYLDFIKKLRSG